MNFQTIIPDLKSAECGSFKHEIVIVISYKIQKTYRLSRNPIYGYLPFQDFV